MRVGSFKTGGEKMLKNADGKYVVKNYQREGSRDQNHIKFADVLNSVTYAGVNHFIAVAKIAVVKFAYIKSPVYLP